LVVPPEPLPVVSPVNVIVFAAAKPLEVVALPVTLPVTFPVTLPVKLAFIVAGNFKVKLAEPSISVFA